MQARAISFTIWPCSVTLFSCVYVIFAFIVLVFVNEFVVNQFIILLCPCRIILNFVFLRLLGS